MSLKVNDNAQRLSFTKLQIIELIEDQRRIGKEIAEMNKLGMIGEFLDELKVRSKEIADEIRELQNKGV